MRICSIEGCERKHKALGYCSPHYKTFCRTGDPIPRIGRGGYHDKNPNGKFKCKRDPICIEPDCDGKHAGWGYCSKHLYWARRYGSPTLPPEVVHARNLTLPEKIAEFTNPPDSNGCRIWTGTNHGYGTVHWGGKKYIIHRKVFEDYHGRKIKKKHDIHHICQVKLCCEITHLQEIHRLDHEKLHGYTFTPPKKPKKKPKEKCKVEDCTDLVDVKGWCRIHYTRNYKYGDPVFHPNGKRIGSLQQKRAGEICSVDDCEDAVISKGMCSIHYQRSRKGTSLDTPKIKQPRPSERKTCIADRCTLPYFASGFCRRCYQREWRDRTKQTKRSKNGEPAVWAPIEVKLAHYIVKQDDGCHIWTGPVSEGYGIVNVNGKSQAAHRYTYEQAKGPITKGYHVHHRCHVPLCVNPDHLQAVTPVEHVLIHEMWTSPNSGRPKGSFSKEKFLG